MLVGRQAGKIDRDISNNPDQAGNHAPMLMTDPPLKPEKSGGKENEEWAGQDGPIILTHPFEHRLPVPKQSILSLLRIKGVGHGISRESQVKEHIRKHQGTKP